MMVKVAPLLLATILTVLQGLAATERATYQDFEFSMPVAVEPDGPSTFAMDSFTSGGTPSLPPTTYTAAVVEHVPVETGMTPGPLSRKQAQDIMRDNLHLYDKHAASAKAQGAQIVVYPEFGLYGVAVYTRQHARPFCEEFPNVLNGSPLVNPATDLSVYSNSPTLGLAARIALKHQLVLVLNMCHAVTCDATADPDCPADGQYQYNTNVALSETGQLLAVYHKSHLYYESQFDEPLSPTAVYFDTSFGIRFGTLICYDMVFPEPQTELRNEGITDFVFTSMWVNFPPLYTATMFQQGFSHRYGINFIASGSANMQRQAYLNSGSGIFSSGSVLAEYYNTGDVPQDKVLAANLTSASPFPPEAASSRPSMYPNPSPTGDAIRHASEAAQVTPIVLSEPNITYHASAKVGTVSCSVEAEISPSSPFPSSYALLAVQGPFQALEYVELCFVVKCADETCASVLSFSPIFRSDTTFLRMELKGSFSSDVTTLPLASTDYSLALHGDAFAITDDSMILQSSSVLLSAGLFGRKMLPNN